MEHFFTSVANLLDYSLLGKLAIFLNVFPFRIIHFCFLVEILWKFLLITLFNLKGSKKCIFNNIVNSLCTKLTYFVSWPMITYSISTSSSYFFRFFNLNYMNATRVVTDFPSLYSLQLNIQLQGFSPCARSVRKIKRCQAQEQGKWKKGKKSVNVKDRTGKRGLQKNRGTKGIYKDWAGAEAGTFQSLVGGHDCLEWDSWR